MAEALDAVRAGGGTVGLVPTMGALHAGHTSLIGRAAAECDAVAVSVFVNPLQFGAVEDLDRYPRRLATDVAVAIDAGARFVYAPNATVMYPAGFATTVHVHGLTDALEGAARPGHFDGVTTVVAKLFAVAGPSRAYFGEKDFQQLQVVRRMAGDLDLPVAVIGCPTVREADGLALSSRNARLTPEERAAAPALYGALLAGAAAVGHGERDPQVVAAVMAAQVTTEPVLTLDYAEAVDPETLATTPRVDGRVRLVIAARAGATRLIDNLEAASPAAVRPSAAR